MAKRQKDGSIILSAMEQDILTVLYKQPPQGVYGLDILEKINLANIEKQRRKVGVGSLYPTLKRMGQQGLIQGRWGDDAPEEQSGGARRRYYKISSDGERALINTWQYRQLLNSDYITTIG